MAKKHTTQSDVVDRFATLSSQRQMHIFTRLNLIADMPSKAMRNGSASQYNVREYVNLQIEKKSNLLEQLAVEIDRVTGAAR